MPDAGGPNGSSPLCFTRRTLEQAACSRAAEHEGVNPHKFYRALREALTNLRGHRDPPYEVVGQRARDLTFDPDAAGERTGAFTARVQGRSQTPALGAAVLEHRPWGPHGAGLVGLGVLVLCFGLLSNPLVLLGTSIALLGVGLFAHTDEAEIPLERRDVVSALVEGEASETVTRTATGRRSDLAAEMGVLYAGDVFLTIPPSRVADLPWAVRAELANRRVRWSQALEDGREPEPGDGIATGFVDALRAWTLLDGDWTRRQIEDLQREVRRSLSMRQAHTELLSRLRPTDVRSRELERVDRELAAWANEMTAYVTSQRGRSFAQRDGTHGEPVDGNRQRSAMQEGHPRPPLRRVTQRPLKTGRIRRPEDRPRARRPRRS